ncbi:hypothetical protein PWR63_26055 [Paraburkholderia sp. A2WS-5]|uniref:LirA/MavJ family T4SS effector n=1 Tax=unclassified Paraburkholderia TaxID=2615204 RepID=UPI003B779455
MKSLEEIRAELKVAFDDKDLKVDGKLLSESPHFNDYLRMGFYLSCGLRGNLRGEPVIRNALIALDADMTQRINKYYSAKSRAIDYFQNQQAAYKANKAPPKKDSDFSKLLTASLDEFERAHGFVVVGDRLPNYAGFVYGNVFKESLALKQHWKDVGAGEKHGEYSHRLQWYILIRAGAFKTVPVNQEATVFASIAPWQKGKTNLWTFLLDQLTTDPSIGNDKLDFRSPENLNMWLVGDASPEFCPVLRAFLRARMAKRESTYNMRDYLVKKLRKSEEEVDEIITYMQMEKMENRNASARIAFPKGANPKFDPYVRT